MVIGRILYNGYNNFFPQPHEPLGVWEFGPLTLGSRMPTGDPGNGTFAPYKEIPLSKFYIVIVQDKHWCIVEDCGIEGALVQTMGGWLQMEKRSIFPDLDEMVGLDLEKNKKVKSLVIIGDHEGNMVGIYPNKNLKDIPEILTFYPELADINLLKGVREFGSLKVGEIAPLKPGDPTGYKDDGKVSHPYYQTHIPKGKKFYVFIFNKHLLGLGYCAFFACETKFDYPNGSYIDDLGGWFSSDGKPETARVFGLDPAKIAQGKQSLVVVTDSKGIIVSLHPNKTLKDIMGILAQHKGLVDMKKIYKN